MKVVKELSAGLDHPYPPYLKVGKYLKGLVIRYIKMDYYPVFLDLKDKECLVVGAGSVGIRKIHTLCKAGPKKITVVDPYLSKDVENFLPSFVCLKKREFREKDLECKFLVIVATNNFDLNKRISKLCNDKNILCNVVDMPDLCSFIVPSIVEKKEYKDCHFNWW